MPALSVLFFFLIEHNVLMCSFFLKKYNGMPEKVRMQRTQRFADCQKIVIECGITFLEIRLFLENHLLEFQEIWQKITLENKYLEIEKKN